MNHPSDYQPKGFVDGKPVDSTAEQTVLRCRQYWSGILTLENFRAILDNMNMRGGIDDDHFAGYDYTNQRWMEINR